MSKALSVRTETLAALASPPPMSASLRYYVSGDAVIGGDLHPVQGTPGPRDIDEARRILPQVEHLCRAPTMGVIAAWCRKLVAHLPKAPDNESDLDLAVQGIALTCGDLPYAVWTGETVTEALRTLEWWPPPAKVRAILLPYASRYRRLQAGLARVVAAGSDAAPPPRRLEDPTPEAAEYVAGVVGAFVGERSFNDPTNIDAARPPKSRHLSDRDLLQIWQGVVAEGDRPGAGGAAKLAAQAAAVRVKMIKENMVWADPGGEA